MNMIPRVSRAVLTVTLLCTALLTEAPSANAARTGAVEAGAAPPAPTLTSATVDNNTVRLLWTPNGERAAADHAIYADGTLVLRTLAPNSATIFLNAEGLAGDEAYTVVAEDAAGDQSAPSNAMTPSATATLPAPELTSAVLNEGTVAMTWTPSRTDEPSGDISYLIFANRFPAMSVHNATSARVPLIQGPFVLTGREVYTVIARDRTMAESRPSNGRVPTTTD